MKIGFATPSIYPFSEKLFSEWAPAGIGAIEISYGSEIMDVLNFKTARKWADKYGIELWSAHLPFWPFDKLDISKPELAENTLEYFKSLIEKINGDAGINRFVLHASGEPISDGERPLRIATAKKYLSALASYARTKGSVVCVENLPRTCLGQNSDEILELISGEENLRACFDTNHLLYQPTVDFIKSVGSEIETVHISDYDYVDEKHWLPGEGKIDWQKLYNTLTEVGYKGNWIYEVILRAPIEMPPRSRDLNGADLVRNANEIFENKPLTKVL